MMKAIFFFGFVFCITIQVFGVNKPQAYYQEEISLKKLRKLKKVHKRLDVNNQQKDDFIISNIGIIAVIVGLILTPIGFLRSILALKIIGITLLILGSMTFVIGIVIGFANFIFGLL